MKDYNATILNGLKAAADARKKELGGYEIDTDEEVILAAWTPEENGL